MPDKRFVCTVENGNPNTVWRGREVWDKLTNVDQVIHTHNNKGLFSIHSIYLKLNLKNVNISKELKMTCLSRTMSLLPHLRDNIFLFLNFTLEKHNHEGGITGQRASYSCASAVPTCYKVQYCFLCWAWKKHIEYSSAFCIELPVISSLDF